MLDQIKSVLDKHDVPYTDIKAVQSEKLEYPVFMLSHQAKSLEMWKKLKALSHQTGFWPFVSFRDTEESLLYSIEHKLEPVETRLEKAKEIILPDVGAESLLEYNNRMLGQFDKNYDPLFDPFQETCHYLGYLHNWQEYAEEINSFVKEAEKDPKIVLVPGENSWTALAYCQTAYGAGYFDNRSDQFVWVRRWEEKYGAQLFMNVGWLLFYVEHPPQTALEAYLLMKELVLSDFGIDMLESYFGEQGYAAHLLDNHYWHFGWD
jgi:hypothetical protein